MKIVNIRNTTFIKKTKKEYQRDLNACVNEMQKTFVGEYKEIPSKEPIYYVEMSMKELQIISFYLELENRKPILNVKIDAKIEKESKDE